MKIWSQGFDFEKKEKKANGLLTIFTLPFNGLDLNFGELKPVEDNLKQFPPKHFLLAPETFLSEKEKAFFEWPLYHHEHGIENES